MSKRVIVIAKISSPVNTPSGQVAWVQKDITKVVELDTTLEELLQYADGKSVDGLTLIFETEDPDLRKPSLVK